jgi:hypothetical protein
MIFGKISGIISTNIFSPPSPFSFISESHSTHDGMLDDLDVLLSLPKLYTFISILCLSLLALASYVILQKRWEVRRLPYLWAQVKFLIVQGVVSQVVDVFLYY